MSSTPYHLPLKKSATTAAASGEPFAAQVQLLHSGGIDRAIRCICVISAVRRPLAADTK